jgi:hypothetical protein
MVSRASMVKLVGRKYPIRSQVILPIAGSAAASTIAVSAGARK